MPAENRLDQYDSPANSSRLQLACTASHGEEASTSVRAAIHLVNHSSWSRGSQSLPAPQSRDGKA